MVVAIVSLIALFVLMTLPRSRETARLAGCRKNLMSIGQALALYDQSVGHLPTVPEPEKNGGGDSPHKALLDMLALPDLTEVTSARTPPPKHPNPPRGARRVPGFVCPSDQNATSAPPAAVSYRATAGAAPDGRDGAFAPGRLVSLARIEAADGLGYTTAFAERLIGNGLDNVPFLGNYGLVSGPVAANGCPALDPPSWRGDAGMSWLRSDWKSTLYNHVQPPGASPSCLAEDGRTASMRASSGHVPGVNVLLFDGSVRTMTPTINLRIWRDWAAFADREPKPAPSLPANPDRKE